MKVNLIESAWHDYKSKVVPMGASPVQVAETRKAFYAGAASLLKSMLTALGPGKEATESDLAIMDGVQEELDEFFEKTIQRLTGKE